MHYLLVKNKIKKEIKNHHFTKNKFIYTSLIRNFVMRKNLVYTQAAN